MKCAMSSASTTRRSSGSRSTACGVTRRLREAKHIHFPLLADFEPKGAVSSSYGAYDGEPGTSKRALFVIDQDGIIRWSYLSPTGVNPGADGILRALESLTASSGAASHGNGQ